MDARTRASPRFRDDTLDDCDEDSPSPLCFRSDHDDDDDDDVRDDDERDDDDDMSLSARRRRRDDTHCNFTFSLFINNLPTDVVVVKCWSSCV